jgi:hypothetical protein
MKNILKILIVLCCTYNANSQNTLKEKFGVKIKDTSGLANFVCATYYSSLNNSDPNSNFERMILERLGVNREHPKSKEIIGLFLNEYHKLLVCGKDSDARLRDSESLIKRSIGRGEYGLINHLMFYEEEFGYDLNSYEIVDEKKETILDYIEKILNDPDLFNRYDKASLKVLHNDFIEYDAKRGSEL